MEYRSLGRGDLRISAIGMGAWQWGARYWSYGSAYDKSDLQGVMELEWNLGVNFLDTAEAYGLGASERLIGELRPRDEEWIIATKYAPLRPSWPGVEWAAEKSLKRLKVDLIDLYQVHIPNPLVSVHRIMREMEKLVKKGKIRYIGVSNYGPRLLQRAMESLSFSDLASDQIHYNLIQREAEQNGTLDFCRKNGITVIAYSPLEQGLLTGKYGPSAAVRGLRRFRSGFFRSNRGRLQPLLAVMKQLGEVHGKSVPQVALNWLISKPNVAVIPGTRNKRHALDNAGGADWRLTAQEDRRLEEAYIASVE